MNPDQTTLTAEERKKIQGRSTEFYNETVNDAVTHKLLLCLLETVQDLTGEVKSLRKETASLRSSHERTERILNAVLTQNYAQPAIRTSSS